MMEKQYADYSWEMAARLLAIDSPSGYTEKAAQWVCDSFRQLGFDARLTRKGGVLVDFGGENKEDGLLLEAHTDTLGAMVCQVKGSGALKLTNLGGMNANNAEAENVRVYTRDGRVYEGTCQLHDPSIHVNGGYNDAKRSWDSVEIILDEDVRSQEDVKALTDELSETETLLQKLEDSRQSQMYAIRDIEEIKERLLSFGKYAENAAPDVIVTLIQTFVERIYITDENDERHCHIFIKGCSKEDYDDFFRATGYIENTQETGAVTSVLPVCDSDECCKYDMIFAIPLRMR